jgi:hypothetical protein
LPCLTRCVLRWAWLWAVVAGCMAPAAENVCMCAVACPFAVVCSSPTHTTWSVVRSCGARRRKLECGAWLPHVGHPWPSLHEEG